MSTLQLQAEIKQLLSSGTVIPAHPLALDCSLKLDEERQRRLTRYYIRAGAGGVAVGVHTTQFEIRNAGVNLLEPVLRLAAEEIDSALPDTPFIKVAGIVGPEDQALREADIALKYGYHLGLLSMGGLNSLSESDLIRRAERVAERIPLFGFYLQPAVGGRVLSYGFWRDFAEIQNVHAIKIAAFNRYQTLDVVRAVCESSRRDDIALYTGNDDNIVGDLLTPFSFNVEGRKLSKRFVGGLLGHWAVWTNQSVKLFREIQQCVKNNYHDVETLLKRNIEVTDMNAAIFDPQHGFKGSIAGIHEVLRRQGLLNGIWCISPEERLSDGQLAEIDRVREEYPHLTDDFFVEAFLKADQ